jgi:hypothetical protein
MSYFEGIKVSLPQYITRKSFIYRVLLTVLHDNENAVREQALRKDGAPRYKLSYPKGKQGDHVLKKVKEDCTYCVNEIIISCEQLK